MPVAIFYSKMRWISFAFSTVSTKTSGYKIVCQANYPAKTNLARSHRIALFLYIYIKMFLYLKYGVRNEFFSWGNKKPEKHFSSILLLYYILHLRYCRHCINFILQLVISDAGNSSQTKESFIILLIPCLTFLVDSIME